MDRSHYTYADDFARNILHAAAPDALIISPDWTFISPALYLQHAENIRQDVAVFDGELLRRSWYFRYLQKRAPWLYDANRAAIEAFLAELSKYEHGQPYDGNVITEKYVTMLNGFLESALRLNHPPYVLLNLEAKEREPDAVRQLEKSLGRPPYITTGVAPDAVGGGLQWIPEMPAFRLYADREVHPLPDVNFPPRPIDSSKQYDGVTLGVFRRYAEFWRWRGDSLRSSGSCLQAVPCYQKALSITPDLVEASEGLAACSH
jgi:hypothetical protein